ncbi:hypothetical protein [Dapis sp. BLCC M172]|uniref:hypothetical protein n=1 Tax=Dapis sp. BLCC M172 TaxID=2975281 RepID=UPI003CEAAA80
MREILTEPKQSHGRDGHGGEKSPSQKISATHPPRHDRRESLRGDNRKSSLLNNSLKEPKQSHGRDGDKKSVIARRSLPQVNY